MAAAFAGLRKTHKIDIAGAFQRFGAAMFVPVLLFAFSGLLVGIAIVFKDQVIVGKTIANPNSTFYKVMDILEEGGWTIFRNMPLFFCIGLPISLAKMAPGRAVLATLICFLSFNYFTAQILHYWGPFFHVNYDAAVGGSSGLAMIAGVKTLDTNIVGGIAVGGIMTYIHNRTYNFHLPEYLGIFQGTSFVHIVGFFAMFVLAFLTVIVWPYVQMGIISMQGFLSNAGVIGVWIYTFLERILIPTGLHHFVYGPFLFGPAVVPQGIVAYWFEHVAQITSAAGHMKDIFPAGGFALTGNSKVFGCPGIAMALYATAKKENKRAVASLVIPAALTAMLVGITEPLEFTFLFVAPFLFLIHAILAATLAAILFAIGLVGDFDQGLLQFITTDWIFMIHSHALLVLAHILIGLSFTVIYFFVFRFFILKFDLKTPGRGDGVIQLFRKADYKAKKADSASRPEKAGKENPFEEQARKMLTLLGGAKNIADVTSCATRLRVTVKDSSLVAGDDEFIAARAHGVVRSGVHFQVIIGLSVPQLRTEFEHLMAYDPDGKEE